MASEVLPSGTVTLLFTDIEGSTQLWERHPLAMREALSQHDNLVRSTIASSGGAVFKTVGDAFCAVFRDPEDALSASITLQRALHDHAWPAETGAVRVRIGIHSGVCTERDGDYFGATTNRVARLMSAAYGEQILLSEATAALLQDALPEGVTLRNVGLIRLKGLSRPEAGFQVIAPGLRADFPAPKMLDSRPNNLPTQISTFVGRTLELQQVSTLLSRGRLLTIVGPGGIGKTRLTLQLCATAADRYLDGRWLVDLSPVRNADFIPQAVADALGVRERAGEQIEATLLEHLVDKTLLLILDNVEHLIGGVTLLAKNVLSKSPGVSILTTSREPLHVVGEQIYRLGPLTEGRALFLERARQIAPMLTLDDSDGSAMASLCAKLENMPLAIELACARLSSMTLEHLERRLRSALTLSSKDSTETSRHRTLRETIAWSYDLLSHDERVVLRALSVFGGACTLDAISAVAPEIANANEIVDSLIDKSLLEAEDHDGDAYYRLLEVVCEYGREQLRQSNEEAAAEAAHAGYYASIVLQAADAYGNGSPPAMLDNDTPNLRLMLEWYFANEQPEAVRLVRTLSSDWRMRGNITEGRSWITRALSLAEKEDSDRARLLCLGASFATLQDDLDESLRLSNEALGIFRSLDSSEGIAQALFRIAEVQHRQGHLDTAEALYRESFPHFIESGDARAEMLCLGNLGMLARQRGDLQQALQLLEDAMERAQRLGEARILGDVSMAIGWVKLGLRDLESSRRLFERTLTERLHQGDRYGACAARHGLATVDLEEGRFHAALEGFMATLHDASELHAKDYIARALHGIAAVKATDGESDLALRLLGMADRLFRESGRELHDSIAYEMAVTKLEAAMPETRRAALRQEGAQMDMRDAAAVLNRSKALEVTP
ncbi:MAG TPA: adenylate/guanylate cyclase domain-containing protein [Candidatus Cybelea sp.]|jgi:predicted ATPase/class 3 adenylate cyclase